VNGCNYDAKCISGSVEVLLKTPTKWSNLDAEVRCFRWLGDLDYSTVWSTKVKLVSHWGITDPLRQLSIWAWQFENQVYVARPLGISFPRCAVPHNRQEFVRSQTNLRIRIMKQFHPGFKLTFATAERKLESSARKVGFGPFDQRCLNCFRRSKYPYFPS